MFHQILDLMEGAPCAQNNSTMGGVCGGGGVWGGCLSVPPVFKFKVSLCPIVWKQPMHHMIVTSGQAGYIIHFHLGSCNGTCATPCVCVCVCVWVSKGLSRGGVHV